MQKNNENNKIIYPDTNAKIPTVLTIKKAVEIVKSDCPETAISEHFLRSLIKDGVLPELKAGNKQLINMDVLAEYLANPNLEKFRPKPKDNGINGIRPVGKRR